MPEQGTINGVNVTQLRDTIDAIQDTPALADFRFRARNRWIEGGHCRTSIQGFYGAGGEDTSRAQPFLFDADEPPVLLGENRGANPVEFVLHALAGCLTTSLIYHAAARGVKIEGVESRFEGNLDLRGFLGLDDRVRNGYKDLRVVFRIKADAPAEQIEDLCRLAQARSPVFDIVRNGVPVSVTLEA